MLLDITKVPSPCYVMEEDLLRKNLSLIKSVADRAGVEIILAFKAFAMHSCFQGICDVENVSDIPRVYPSYDG